VIFSLSERDQCHLNQNNMNSDRIEKVIFGETIHYLLEIFI